MIRLTRRQVREVDRLAIEEYHIPGIVLMENAARGAAAAARDMLPDKQRAKVLVLCGGGNNGGDGLAVARHLHNAGHDPLIGLYIDPDKYKGDALTNWEIARAMVLGTTTGTADTVESDRWDLIVDAVFGTGLAESPRPPFAELVAAVAAAGAPVLAVDLPSGLDCDTGLPLGACLRATRTVTFVAEKAGFANPTSRQYTGRVTVADIGCPRELIERVRG